MTSAGIEHTRKMIEVTARASRRSEMNPAEIPPNTPPTSNIVESIPAVLCDNCCPATAVKARMIYNTMVRLWDILIQIEDNNSL